MKTRPAYLLGIDIGNTNIVIGLSHYDTDDLEVIHQWRTTTKLEDSSEKLVKTILAFLESVPNSFQITPQEVEAIIFSSVVPSLAPKLREMAERVFAGKVVYEVTWDMGIDLELDYPHPSEIGADRLVNAVAVSCLFGGDLIVVDMGTATTFCVIHDSKHYLGGCIAPGLGLSMDALVQNAAQIEPIVFEPPSSGIIASSTSEALQAGFFFGWIGLVREILMRLQQVHPQRRYRIIATGGLANFIGQAEPTLFDEVDPLLTSRGLKAIHLQMRFKKKL